MPFFLASIVLRQARTPARKLRQLRRQGNLGVALKADDSWRKLVT